MKRVLCTSSKGFTKITENKEYEVLEETNNYYKIKNDTGIELEYKKELFSLIKKKTSTYAEEQLEHAKEKQDRCYNKECQHMKDNKCYILKADNCSTVLKEPINYEEEYNKLKKENEELKERNKLLEERVKMQKSTIIDLKESLDNKEKQTNINNYESEINKLRCQYEEAKYYIEAKEIEIKNINKKLEESEMTVKMIKRLVEGQ